MLLDYGTFPVKDGARPGGILGMPLNLATEVLELI
jgi:hypothetical protein